MKGFVSRPKLATWLYAAGALAVGCSFQKFDYLQDSGASLGGGGVASAGSGGAQGGTKPVGQSGAGESMTAGTATVAGKGGQTHGGEAGAPVKPGDAGAGGAGGDDSNGGTGAVGELVNPSFETFNTVGWTLEPPGPYAKVQAAQGQDHAPDGGLEFSTWSDTLSYTVELYQNILGLEDGKYTFKGYVSSGLVGAGAHNVWMFARKCGGAVDPDPIPIPAQTWTPVQIKGIEVVGGSCEVGLRIESTPLQWMNADLFTFTKDVE